MRNLHLSLLTQAKLGDPGLARDVLGTIIAAHPDLRPRRYGGIEPLPFRFGDDSGVSDLLAAWESPLFWNQGRRTAASFFFGRIDTHSTIHIGCTASRIPPAALAEVLENLSRLLAPDFASIFFRFEQDDQYVERYKAVYPFCVGPSTHDLRRSLPDLPWYSIFGPPYVSMFGKEKLSTCPGYACGPQGPQRWALKLVEDPRAALNSPEVFSSTRDSAKSHLGLEHFLDLSDPERQQRVPSFGLA